MEYFEIMDKLNMKQPKDLEKDWFEYFINDYIPSQNGNDEEMFIDLGFSPTAYIIWKALEEDILDGEFAKEAEKALDERIKKLNKSGGI
jgi:hypothetical protein